MVQYKQPLQAGTSAVDGMYTYCVVQDVDLTNKVAHVVDQLGNPRQVSITRSMGPAAAYPKVGENWIISRQYGDWIFAVSLNNGLVTGPVGPQGPQGKPYNDPAVNLVTDFSFDQWTPVGQPSRWSTFWASGGPSVSHTVSPVSFDDNGIRVTFNATSSYQRLESPDVYAITPGQRYLISVWAKGSSATCQLDFTFLGNTGPTIPDYFIGGTSVYNLIAGTVLTTGWVLYQGLWTCPTGINQARPVISVYGNSGDVIDVDRATVRIADVPNPFNGVPVGGGALAVLAKNSSTDFDEYWAPGSVAPSANSVMYRDASNRSQVADPSAAADIATKNYTDTQITTAKLYAVDRVKHPFAGTDPADGKWHYVGMPGEPALTNGTPYELPGTNYGWPRFRKDPEGCVWIEALLTGTSGFTAGTAIFTLPAGYRPANALIFYVEGSGSAVQVRVSSAGVVTYQSSQVAPAHMALDNISFMAEDFNPPTWTALTLSNGWSNIGGGFNPAQVYVDSCGDAHFSGVVTGGATGNICAALPAGSYDTVGSYTRVQSAWSNAGMCRIDVSSAGVLSLAGYGTGGSNASVSLDNLVIPNIGGFWGAKADFVNSWVNYGSIFPPMGITVNKNGIASLRGLIKLGTAATITSAALNPLYMPTHQKIFITGASSNKHCRVDVVNANGLLSLVGYYDGGTNAYVSLDTMRWNTQFAK